MRSKKDMEIERLKGNLICLTKEMEEEINFLDQLTFHESLRSEECEMVFKRIEELTALARRKK